MSKHPTIAALKAAIETESDELSPKYIHGNHIAPVHPDWNRYNRTYKSGHEAATARLLPLIEKLLEANELAEQELLTLDDHINYGKMERYYQEDRSHQINKVIHKIQKAREFLAEIEKELK